MESFNVERPDFSPYGFTCVRWKATPAPRVDHHNELEINFLPAGSVTYLFGGRKVRVEAGEIVAFWAAIPHQVIEVTGVDDYFVATIPLVWFLQFRLPDDFVQRLLSGEVLRRTDTSRNVLDHALFAQWQDDMRDATPETINVVALEVEARLRRLAAALPKSASVAAGSRRRPTLTDVGLTKIERMACQIARRYTEKITAEEIGRAAGLHPVYAASLFKKTFGVSFVEYVAYHRVSHAQRLLATTRDSVVDVAFEAGFNSISRFNETFRRECGCTPTEYRARHTIVA